LANELFDSEISMSDEGEDFLDEFLLFWLPTLFIPPLYY
jgi:hypothetical protein